MSNAASHWMVPLRRAVVRDQETTYLEFHEDWLERLRDTDNSFVLGVWYRDPESGDFSPVDYNKGVVAIRRWINVTFGGQTVATSPVATTTLQTRTPNFHCRLWKGPKRILLEQNAKDDADQLAQVQPFSLVNGCIELQLDDQGKPKQIPLLPGDVLEVPLHEFLVACGQSRYADVEFDPKGSFYLGTSVKSKSGRKRMDLPILHDNMLAMRFQLLTALNMANCYHDEPVYTDVLSVNPTQLRPEGAGVFARGMPFGGNPAATVETGSGLHWQIKHVNANQPEVARPVYMPTHAALRAHASGLPLTWGWTCSPWALFYFFFMADAHQSKSGLVFPNGFRNKSLALSLCLSTNRGKNTEHIDRVIDFQGKNANDPLLLHNLEVSDLQVPREQPPLADLCEIVFPEGRAAPEGRPFTDPDDDRIGRIPQPQGETIDEHDWNDLCPDASIVVVSAGAGHEFGLVKLRKADGLLDATKAALAQGDVDSVQVPRAGCLSAYNPLTGEDYCDAPSLAARGETPRAASLGLFPEGCVAETCSTPGTTAFRLLPLGENPGATRHDGFHHGLLVGDGHFFVNESSARMPPKDRGKYKNLHVAEIKLHKFQPTPANKARFRMQDDVLQISDDGRDFRDKGVSSIIYIRAGTEGDTDPRTLSNIYSISRESWIPIRLNLSSSSPNKAVKGFLDDYETLYAERAVPFPTIREVAAGLPDRARVAEQLANHARWLTMLGQANAEAWVKAQLEGATSEERNKLNKDLKLFETDENGVRKWETLRRALIALVSPSTNSVEYADED